MSSSTSSKKRRASSSSSSSKSNHTKPPPVPTVAKNSSINKVTNNNNNKKKKKKKRDEVLSDDNDDQLLLMTQFCDASEKRDAKRIGSLLGYNNNNNNNNRSSGKGNNNLLLYSASCNMNEPLLAESAIAERLGKNLFGRQEEQEQQKQQQAAAENNDSQQPDADARRLLVVQGLLMAPSAYETPWKTALGALDHYCCTTPQQQEEPKQQQQQQHSSASSNDNDIDDDDDDELLSSLIPHLQCFLQQQITAWWWREEQRSRSTTTTTTTASSSSSSTIITAVAASSSPPKKKKRRGKSTTGTVGTNSQSSPAPRPDSVVSLTNSTGTSARAAAAAPPRPGEVFTTETPRDWILLMVNVIMEPMSVPLKSIKAAAAAAVAANDDSERTTTSSTPPNNTNNHRYPALQILSTVLSALQEIQNNCKSIGNDHHDNDDDDPSNFAALLSESILKIIFPRGPQQQQEDEEKDVVPTRMIRPHCLVPWIQLMTDIQSSLRSHDWIHVRGIVLHLLQQQRQEQQPSSSLDDLPRLTDALLALFLPSSGPPSVTSTTTRRDSTDPFGFEILWTLWTVASTNVTCSSTGGAAYTRQEGAPTVHEEKNHDDSSFSSRREQALSSYYSVENIIENRLAVALPWFPLLSPNPRPDPEADSDPDDGGGGSSSFLTWLQEKQAEISDEETPLEKPWMLANMLLLILRAWQESRRLTVVVGQHGRRRPGVNDSCRHEEEEDADPRGAIWKQLLAQPVWARFKDSRKEKAISIKDLQEIMADVSYMGMGRFERKNGETVEPFTEMGRSVCQSLFLSVTNRHRPPSSDGDGASQYFLLAKERAKAWLDIGMHAIVSHLSSKGTVTATPVENIALPLIVVITIHCELSFLRPMLVKDILRTLGASTNYVNNNNNNSSADTQTVATVHILVVSVILRSTYGKAAQCRMLNELSDVFKMDLSPGLFWGLSKALLPLRSTPKCLLSSATKRLTRATFSGSPWVRPGDSDEVSDSVKCGLLSLCILVGMPDSRNGNNAARDQVQMAAWNLLFGIVAHNAPPLPTAAYPWLFGQIQRECQKGNDVSTQTMRRLLRAMLIRLLHLFGNDGLLLPERLFASSGKCTMLEDHSLQVDDVYSATLLVFCLLRHDLMSVESKGNNVMELFRLELFRVLRDWRKDDPATALRLIVPTIGPDAPDAVTQKASLRVLAMLFQYMLGKTLAVDCPGIPSSPTELSEVLQSVELHGGSLGPGTASAEVLSFNNATSAPPKYDPCWEKDLRRQLCEHFSVFLTETVVEFKPGLTDVLGLSALMKLTQEPAEDKHIDEPIWTDPGDLYSTFHGFCQIAVPALHDLIVKGGPIGEFNEILIAVLNLCHSVQDCVEETTSTPNGSLLTALLSVYELLCTENSVVVLFKYVESQCFDKEDTAREGSTLADVPIETHCDLDTVARSIRAEVIGAIRGYLQAILGKPTTCNYKPDAGTCEQCSALIQIIGILSRDLLLGLDGESGCIVSELYLAFVKTIQLASRAISRGCPVDNNKQILTTCIKSAEYLEGVVCSVSPERSESFKAIMTLLGYNLPSVVSAFVRQTALENCECDPRQLKKIHSYSKRLFEQCLAILLRRSRPDVTHTTPWEEVAGPDHLVSSLDQIHQMTDDESSGRSGRSDRRRRRLEEFQESTARILQLESERTWTWALSYLFDAYGCLWVDAQQDEGGEFLSIDSSSLYMKSRATALADILGLIGLVFLRESHSGRSEKSRETNGPINETSPHLPALILPAAAKVALCTLLDRVFAALDYSLNILMGKITDLDDIKSLGVVEAVGCATAWIGTDSKKNADAMTATTTTTAKDCAVLDLLNGVRLWHAAEATFSSHSSGSNSVYVADASVLRKLPSLVVQAEELEETLESFHDALQTSLPNKSVTGGATSSRDSSAESVTSHDGEPRAFDDGIRWLELVDTKLHALKKERSEHENEMRKSAAALAGIYGPERMSSKRKRKPTAKGNGIGTNVDGSFGEENATAAESSATNTDKRRRVTAAAMSMSVVPRSRNRIVDEWLQKDHGVHDEEVMEEDAYADLEDFVVEG